MSEELQKQVGETIRLLRLLLRLSYAQLAERSGVSSVYLRQVERGERDVGMDKLTAIARGLGLDLAELLPGEARSALARAFADSYANAPADVREAIVFLLAEPQGPRLEALLSLVPAEFGETTTRAAPPADAEARPEGPSSDKTKR